MRLLSLATLLVFLGCSTANAGSKNQSSPLEQLLSQVSPKTTKPSSLVGSLELLGVIDSDSTATLIAQMDALKAAGATQIVIRINSPGGSVMAGQLLAQRIETIGVPVICIGDSNIQSMAFYLLQSCTERWATKRTVFMAHPPSDHNVEGNPEQLKEEVSWMDSLADAMAEHEAARLKISLKQFKAKIAHHAWFFNWNEALKVGAIDKVVAPRDIPLDIEWN